MKYDLVFDIGGTKVLAGRYDCTGKKVDRVKRVASPVSVGGLARILLETGFEVMDGSTPVSIGIGVPGPVGGAESNLRFVTIDAGEIITPDSLCKEIRDAWPSARILLINDVSATGYFHVSKGRRDFCIVNIGSGVGHKVFLNGKPQLGPNARGGEIGHLIVDDSPGAFTCDCGGRGHLGGIASGRGALALARRCANDSPQDYARSLLSTLAVSPSAMENRHLVEAYRSGDAWCRDVVGVGAAKLGMAIAAIHLAVGVEDFIICGGFGAALGSGYIRQIAVSAERHSWRSGKNWQKAISIAHDSEAHLSGLAYAIKQSAEDGSWL